MGGIIMSGARWVGELSDIAGFKVGIAADRDALRAGAERVQLGSDLVPVMDDLDVQYRIRSEIVAELVRGILIHLGDPDASDDRPISIALQEDLAGLPDLDCVMKAITQNLPLVTSGRSGFESAAFLAAMEAACGPSGRTAGLHAMRLLEARSRVSPWSRIRRREWADVLELRELFESEEVAATYGTFFDQRFIDFLAANFAEVDRMHWRKFEALAAEWYDRMGYDVELGPGRDDDGVDLRAWPQGGRVGPPVLVAQCKREKGKISKVVLKALFADVQYEKAGKGVIVTTSRFAPGTERVNTERGYGIEEANREVVQQWVTQLRTPGTGVFLGE